MRDWSIGGMIIAREKSKYSELTVWQNHFAHHKLHMNCPGIEPVSAVRNRRLTA
jgi:hypothetical protein